MPLYDNLYEALGNFIIATIINDPAFPRVMVQQQGQNYGVTDGENNFVIMNELPMLNTSTSVIPFVENFYDAASGKWKQKRISNRSYIVEVKFQGNLSSTWGRNFLIQCDNGFMNVWFNSKTAGKIGILEAYFIDPVSSEIDQKIYAEKYIVRCKINQSNEQVNDLNKIDGYSLETYGIN